MPGPPVALQTLQTCGMRLVESAGFLRPGIAQLCRMLLSVSVTALQLYFTVPEMPCAQIRRGRFRKL